MTPDQATDLIRETISLTLLLSLPILMAALLIGLVISLLQAVTQIQEQTLSFVPKVMGMGIIAVVAAPWMIDRILDFSARMFSGF